MDQYTRTAMLLGEEGIRRLRGARVAVFGLGGVGGHAAEALARSGVGALDLVDPDVVSLTNLNRQLVATHATLGRLKAEVMAERIRDIAPDIRLELYPLFYLPENADRVDLTRCDYVVDAIDTVTAKLALIARAKAAGVPVISAMGAGNKLDPTALRVADISQTRVCPLARIMRRELARRGIEGVKVVYSLEPPAPVHADLREETAGEGAPRRDVPGSTAFVPAAMGLIMAGEVVKDLAFHRSGIRPAAKE